MTELVLDPYAYPPVGMNREAAARYVGLPVNVFDILVKMGRFPKAQDLGGVLVWERMELDAAFRASVADSQPVAKNHSGTPMSEEHPGYHNVYTSDSLAERWRCSGAHIRNMIRRGELDAFKYGGKLTRITAAAVAAYEKANIVAPRR